LNATLLFASTSDSKEAPRLRAEYAGLLDRVRAIPGVQSAGTIDGPPLGMYDADGSFKIEGRTLPDDADAGYSVISSGYFRTLRIPIVSGRDFTDADTTASMGVAIVSSAMARRYWPGRSPLGDRIIFDSMEEHAAWLTVVGVVADVRQSSLSELPTPQAYVCYTQASDLLLSTLTIRTPLAPASLASAVRAAVGSVDHEIAVDIKTMDEQMAEAVARQRFQMQVLGGFAALAMLLAAVGLYGVLSYLVAASRGEIGIRMALGAQPASVFRMVTGRALRWSALGAGMGLAGCVAMRRIVASLLFGVGPSDPVTLAGATIALLAVAIAASAFPALRAMRIDPVSALREE